MAETTTKLQGIDDLKRAVAELDGDLRKKVIMSALRDAAKPVLAAAKTMAPFRTGLVRSALVIARSKIYKGQNGTFGVFIRPRPEKGRRVKGTRVKIKIKNNDPFYYRFLELGTRKMRARRFLRPAAQQTFPDSVEVFTKRLAERIAKANHRK